MIFALHDSELRKLVFSQTFRLAAYYAKMHTYIGRYTNFGPPDGHGWILGFLDVENVIERRNGGNLMI